VELGAGGNVFVNGYYARLVPDAGYTVSDLPVGSEINHTEDGIDYYKSYYCTWSNYTNDYYYSSDNTLYYKNSDRDEYGYSSSAYGPYAPYSIDGYYMVNTSYEQLNGSIKNAKVKFTKTIDVYVTAFNKNDYTFTINNESHTYRIGDPRQKGSFKQDTHINGYNRNDGELYDYYVSGKKQNSYYYRKVNPWSNASDIMVGGTTTSYDNIIAPLFKIQSSYGSAKQLVYFDVAQKRCATYQEAGYPAGRWRLPTLAEVAYVIYLQNKGVINDMFNSNNAGYGYWTSSQGIMVVNDYSYTANVTTKDYSAYVRCVYDLWYWGSDQVKPTHEFHPMPTK
jgi:hypothetical protein